MVLLSRQRDFCDITTLVKRTRGQKTERQKDLKTFFKKVKLTLDFVTSVIYVTRITTGAMTDFVAVPACNYLFGQGYAHLLIGEKAMTKKETTIINNIHKCAKACSKDAAELKKECKALYEEVKDFIADETLDLDDYLYGVKLTLKDEAELTFTTDTETGFHDRDTKVRIMETNLLTSILGIHDYSYRDDFVEDYIDYIKDRVETLCERGHDSLDYEDDLNAAGENLYYSLLKTALTVAKERMAKWDGIDHTIDDDDECEECAE